MWEVRLTILLQLVHWKLRAADVWTVPMTESTREEAERRLARVGASTRKIQL